jgi:6-phosphogluconolactonase (cycloisomerase 2 family)
MLMIIHSLLALMGTPADTLYVGSYTQQANPGIEIIDTQSKQVIETMAVPQASYQLLTNDQKYLFSVSEQVGNQGAVYSFKKNNAGKWEKVSQQLTQGDAPCHINFRKKSQTLYTANYMGGSVSVFQTKKGEIYPLAQKIEFAGRGKYPQQSAPHAHMVVFSQDEQAVHISDLGADRIYHYRLRPNGLIEGMLIYTQFPEGTGPRHFVFSADEKFVYVLGELSGTVDVYAIKGKNWEFVQREVIDFSKEGRPKASADLHISPDGKWLLASNRITQNSIVVLRIQPNGKLVFKQEVPVGKVPRNFQFDQTGKRIYVVCKEENRIQQFSFDTETGELLDLKDDILVKSPVALLDVGR